MTNTSMTPSPQETLIIAARRVVAARNNPNLDWGKTKAMEELSFALDDLTQAVEAIDKKFEPDTLGL